MKIHLIATLATFMVCLVSCKSASPLITEKNLLAESQDEAIKLAQQVVIRRTQYGIPHVEAENIEAAGFALAYLQMEDQSSTVVELLLKARGEWAKYHDFGLDERTEAIDDDAESRLKYLRAVETFDLLEPDTQAFIGGFVRGLNRYIQLYPSEFPQSPTLSFTVYDVHARNIVAPSNNSIRRFLSAYTEKVNEQDKTQVNQQAELLTHQTIWAKLAARAEEPNPDVGSNALALAPQRTVSGNTILMRNPHLSWDAGYYEAHIKVPGKLNFYGDFRIGQALGIIGGFNERLGWATTNNAPDLDEIYSFTADPEKPDHYILDGVSHPLIKKQINIEYKFGDAIASQSREFYFTEHGPVILKDAGKIYIIKSAGDGEFRTGEQFFKMMAANNLQEWKKAMQIRARISSNLTYADADGNIFYVWNATMPERPHAAMDDKTALHITSTDQMWSSYTQWERLPQLENPEGGYIRNENDTYHFTNLHEVLRPEAFPDFYPQPTLGLRSQHGVELIHNDKKFSLEEVVTLKHSELMLMAERVKDDLIEAVEQGNPKGEILDAIQLIKDWDNTVSANSRGGVLFKTWWNRYVSSADDEKVESTPASVGYSATAERLFKQPWLYEQPIATPYGLSDYTRAASSFEWAVNETTKRYGHWGLAWGEVHRAVVGEADLPVGGCTGLLGCYRVLWFTQHEQSEQQLKVRGGDGWVMAVEFGETPKAYTVLAYGQSDKANSVHHSDQLANFTNNIMTPVAFSDADVKKQVIREYRPGIFD